MGEKIRRILFHQLIDPVKDVYTRQLLAHQEHYKIVKSSSISIWQHNPFSWEINGDDFSYRSELTGDARYLNATLNQWIRAMSAEERAQLVDTCLLYTSAHVSSPAARARPHPCRPRQPAQS